MSINGKKPLIALPAGLNSKSTSVPAYEIKQAYIRSVQTAGGLPVVLPASIPENDYRYVVDSFDGFLFSGGGDIDPRYYQGSAQPNMHGINPERDVLELSLIPLIIKSGKPLLAICRGVQVLNVALGGDLFGDIKTQLPLAQKHDWFPSYDRGKLVHTVAVAKGTRLATILNAERVNTNSLHHQALNRIGAGLIVSAVAEDGVIEAVELPDAPFAIGVQWHPEWLQGDPTMRSLFQAFVQSC